MSKGSELQLRIISAAVLLPVGIGIVWWGGHVFAIAMSAVAAGLSHEWLKLSMPERDQRLALIASLLAGLSVGGLALQGVLPESYRHIPTMLPVIAILVAWLSARGNRGGYPIAVIGLCYIMLSVLGLTLIRASEGGLLAVLSVFAVVIATDIGAFFVGRAIGGPKLAPRISPGKTWSGAIGGVVAAEVVLICVRYGFADAMPDALTLGVGALLSAASQIGDLAESALKRRAGAKDSGSLIPGHGGLLDRFDGFLAAALVLFLLKLSGMPALGQAAG